MPIFTFQTIDARGEEPTKQIVECIDVDAAVLDGRRLLADLAAEGLPENAMGMISVEVFDSEKRPIVEYRLLFEEIAKS